MVESLCGQPEKMPDGARLVHDFQPPNGAVSKVIHRVADQVAAYLCSLMPNSIIIRQIDGVVP